MQPGLVSLSHEHASACTNVQYHEEILGLLGQDIPIRI